MKIRFGNKTNLKEIEKIAKEIAKYKGVKAVYLFGSHARNKIHALSDIDLCIINQENEQYLSKKIMNFTSDNLDLSIFSKLPINIQIRVFKEGKPLIINDKSYITKSKFLTLRRYLDFKPAIDRFCRETLNV